MRGAGLVGVSFEIVASGVLSELLLEELDWAMTARGVRSKKVARYTRRDTRCQEEDDFDERDTIWIRRSREVYGSEGVRGKPSTILTNSKYGSSANLDAANKAILQDRGVASSTKILLLRSLTI